MAASGFFGKGRRIKNFFSTIESSERKDEVRISGEHFYQRLYVLHKGVSKLALSIDCEQRSDGLLYIKVVGSSLGNDVVSSDITFTINPNP